MKITRSFACLLLSLAIAAPALGAENGTSGDIPAVMNKIRWFGQSSIRIEAGKKVIWIDPLYYARGDKADIILITHLHGDHYVEANVRALMKKDTVVVAPVDLGLKNRVMKPGTASVIDGIPIEAVPAYNIVKAQNHPKSAGNDGYIVTVNGVRIWHAGDTELIPEMKDFHCDIALVPLGQTYTFASVDDAVQAVIDSGAKAAIPIHYGLYEGKDTDALYFADKLRARGIVCDVRRKE